jgi:hypothetical protein
MIAPLIRIKQKSLPSFRYCELENALTLSPGELALSV